MMADDVSPAGKYPQWESVRLQISYVKTKQLNAKITNYSTGLQGCVAKTVIRNGTADTVKHATTVEVTNEACRTGTVKYSASYSQNH